MKKKIPFIAGALIILWIASGFYTVRSGEEAVVLRFGKLAKVVNSGGLKWHLRPFESVKKVNLSEVRRLEFGFQTVKQGSKSSKAEYTDVPSESLMLTGDENLASVEMIIQYKIESIKDFLFNVDDPIGSLRVVAESSIRRVIGNHPLDDAMTSSKAVIEDEIRSDLQEILDKYEMGVKITATQLQDVSPPNEDVDKAFKDVASAKEDKTSKINQAESYANDIIPKARGEAAKMINDAEGYKQQRISTAKGDAENFLAILNKYQEGKEVTKTRMYLEMLDHILPNLDKYIIDTSSNTLKFLPLTPEAAPTEKPKEEK